MTRRGAVGTALLVAGGFLLMQLAWALTMPAAMGIDEFDHIHRAASVGTGHWGASHRSVPEADGRGGLVPVPRDTIETTGPACDSFRYTGPANCTAYAEVPGDPDTVLVASAASRYNPVYYVPVGYPSSLVDGTTALLVMRVVSSLLSAAVLGLGALAITTWARTRWPLLGLFLAATPTVLYSSSLATPNGLNIVSGLSLWAALLGLLHGPDDRRTRSLLFTVSAVSAATLVTTHTLGLVWLGLIVTAVAIQRGRLTLPRVPLAQRRAAWTALAFVALAVAFAIAWVLVSKTNDPSSEVGELVKGAWWKYAFTVGVPLWPLQAIAAFPMRDQMAPLAVYGIGASMMMIVAVLAVASLRKRGQRGSLLAIAFVAVMSYAVPLTLTALTFRELGLAWQGRYEMPFTGGLLLLFGLALDRGGLRVPMRVCAPVLGLLGLMNLLGQLRITRSFVDSGVARAMHWDQPAAWLLAALALGYALLATLAVGRFPTSLPSGEPLPRTTPTADRAEVPVA